ncbi:exonuclease [Saccharibacillus sp. O16]|nr:exonuclease [Saccharibacillus sp. O16]
MKYVVLDLEFTVLRTKKHLAETLEIGAIELTTDHEGTLHMSDLFHSYVRPSHSQLSALTTAFTGITQAHIADAPHFEQVIEEFKKWLGEDYYLCAWSDGDRQQLTDECYRHGMDMGWIRNYNDLQLMYSELKEPGCKQRFGLAASLEKEQLTFIGTQHCAIDDAFNTAKLFRLIYPFAKFERNKPEYCPAKIVFSTGNPKNYPLAALRQLLDLSSLA